tara:strand:- start:334 stop:1470 length:1137 start_codon:yes stop_codon:yes gene_type:complete
MIKYQNPFFTGKEINTISSTIKSKNLIGPDNFIKKCELLLENQLSCKKILLTSSGTDALEMACILANFSASDEVIIPSYNFPSAATSIIRCGAIPVFVEVNSYDMNISLDSVKKAINPKTKGIILTHYAGVSAQIIEIMKIAKKHKIVVIEDAAQAIYAKNKNKFLGTIGDLGILSFHQTKNIFCGEGGALLVNNRKYISRANIIREKGTNRNEFLEGKVNKYNWVDIGSSFLPSSLQAAFLFEQLKNGEVINKKRKMIFEVYHNFFSKVSKNYNIRTPYIDDDIDVNGHFYWILIHKKIRNKFLKIAKMNAIELTTHFEPLHNSKAGKLYGRCYENLNKTTSLSKEILRIPIHTQMTKSKQKEILNILDKTIKDCLF